MAKYILRKATPGSDPEHGDPVLVELPDFTVGGLVGSVPILHVRDEKASGTAGGGFTSGSWQTRTLNTEKTNQITGASLSSSQITLPAGTYEIFARAPAFRCDDHKAKLYNVTDGADLVIGSNSQSGSVGAYSMTDSIVRGQFTLATAKVLELRHQCLTTRATNGWGTASTFGVVEVFAEVLIRQLAT